MTHPDHAHTDLHALVLFAQDVPQLRAACSRATRALRADPAALQELAAPARASAPPTSAPRLGFLARSPAEAADLLELALQELEQHPDQPWQHPSGIAYRPQGQELAGGVVALFAGQGSQYLGMGGELYQRFPLVRDAFEQLDQLFAAEGKPTVSETVYPPPAEDKERQAAQIGALQRTDYAQPAIGALSAGMYRLLRRIGFQPDFAAGHSFGELTALWAAAAVADADYFSLVKARGAAMANVPEDAETRRHGDTENELPLSGGEGRGEDELPASPPDPGAMLAVKAGADQVRPIIARVEGYLVANVNAPTQVVVAGPRARMAEARQALKEAGFSSTPLPVSAAFHTPLVGHAQQPFARAIRAVPFRPPAIPVYSNATARPYPAEPEAVQAVLAEHLVSPVLFLDEVEALYRDGGRLFVEFGPRNILTTLVRDTLRDRPHHAVALNPARGTDSLRQFLEAVIQLRVLGLPLQALEAAETSPRGT